MLLKCKTRKTCFWLILSVCLLLGGGQIVASSGPNSSDIIITEFLAANETGLTDEDGDHSDWIEIYNRSSLPVNLAGWFLTDDPEQPQKWPFPDMSLGSEQYLIVFASGKNRRMAGTGEALHTNFKLSKDGDFLALYNVFEGGFMDPTAPQYPKQFDDVAYGRYGADVAFGYLDNATPGGPNNETVVWQTAVSPVAFSPDRGFYDAPFTVELSTSNVDTVIRYTLDGTVPTETHGAVYTEPISIKTTTLLRAAAFQPGSLSSEVSAHTYIFLDDVLSQASDPAGLPASWGAQLLETQGYANLSPISPDYEMDPEIAGDPRYQDRLKEELKALPTLSLVLEAQALADLHAPPGYSASQSEYPASVELIHPEISEPEFQAGVGLELFDDLAGSESGAKRSFKLLFKKQHGPARLEYALFPDSPVESFDALVLRGASAGDPTTYVRDQWLQNTQAEMSGLGAHGIFVHLYLNGLYWGVYNVGERSDAAFMSSYLGGEKEDWFVVTRDDLRDGDLGGGADRLSYLLTTLSLIENGQGDLVSPERLAETYAALASYIDPVQFSDYMILNWYSEALGWPRWEWRLANRRQDLVGRAKFLVGLELSQSQNSAPSTFGQGEPIPTDMVQTLFETLMEDPDFRVVLADRVYEHFFNDGALADANAMSRWQQLANEVGQGIISESARWGDSNREQPITYEEWLKAWEGAAEQMGGNAVRVINKIRMAGYYPELDPPVFNHEEGLVEAGFALTMTPSAPDFCQNCRIYYTTDGSDPRLPVTGDVIPTALIYEGPIVLTSSTHIKARVWSSEPSMQLSLAEKTPSSSMGTAGQGILTDAQPAWSALHEAVFNVVEHDHKLHLTEVMYNPLEGDDYEFIELKNTGNSEVSLANLTLEEGVRFTFPPSTPPLAPGEFAVLVSNPTAFAERYPGIAIRGVYEGHLSNKGEEIILKDSEGRPLVTLSYNDEYGWPISADGRGDSLVLVKPDGDVNNPRSWRASINLYGSPGADEPLSRE